MEVARVIAKFPNIEKAMNELNAFSYETYIHSLRAAEITSKMVDKISNEDSVCFSAQEKETLVIAACLHDMGKFSVPHAILTKPGALTDEEYNKIKWHPLAAQARIVELKLPKEIEEICVSVALNHHRKIDGSGYPNNIEGPVPYYAQLVQIADIYEALTAERCYKKPLSHDKAIAMMLAGECGALNESLMTILQEVTE